MKEFIEADGFQSIHYILNSFKEKYSKRLNVLNIKQYELIKKIIIEILRILTKFTNLMVI